MTESHPCEQDQSEIHTTSNTDYGALIPDYAITQLARFMLTKLQVDSPSYIYDANESEIN